MKLFRYSLAWAIYIVAWLLLGIGMTLVYTAEAWNEVAKKLLDIEEEV